MRATARVFEVEPNTGRAWRVEAAEQLRAFSRYCLCAIDVGPRTLAMAQGLGPHVVRVLAPACLPLLLTDGFTESGTAL